MKYITYICLLLAVATIAYAQEDQGKPAPRIGAGADARIELRKEKMEVRAEARADAKADIRQMRGELKEERRELWQDWKSGASTTKEEIKQKLVEFRAEIKEQIAERRDEVKKRIASSTADIKARFDENKKARVEQRVENIQGKFSAAIARIERFDDKVEAAIALFEGKGVDTSAAEELLDIARDELENTNELISDFASSTDNILDNDEVSKLELKSEIELVMESIKATHAAYVNVVAELNASGKDRAAEDDDEDEDEDEDEDDDNATTTATSTATTTATTTGSN